MDPTERLLIERECERLMTIYCHDVDHGEAERVIELFSEDGSWRTEGIEMEGRDELRRGFAARQANRGRRSRHVCTNARVDVVDADHAEGCVYLTLYRDDGTEGRPPSPLTGPLLIGEYRDRFVRTPAGWRFSSRRLEVAFRRNSSL